MPAAKKSQVPSPDELLDTLRTCADALLDAHGTLTKDGNVRAARSVQAVEPALRRAADALEGNLSDVTAALEQASRASATHTKDDD